MPRRPRPLAKRFWEKVAYIGAEPDDCWEWQGCRQRNGYGKIGNGGHAGRTRLTHQVAWELSNNSMIPARLQVMHSCDNPPCVNPAHLSLGTQRDNTLDMIAKGRGNYPVKTHCKRGHPFDEGNTYVYPNGHRECRTCQRWHNRQRSRGYGYR